MKSSWNFIHKMQKIIFSTYVLEIETPPGDIVLSRTSPDSVILRWSYPSSGGMVAECGLYFVIGGTIDR
jgi:hypothetical protein